MASYKHVDVDHLNLMADGSVDFIEDLVLMFLKQSPVFTVQLEELCANGENVSLAKLAHRVKGSASMIGIGGLAKLMKTIESKSISGASTEELLVIIKQSQSVVAEATEELKRILNDFKTNSYDKY